MVIDNLNVISVAAPPTEANSPLIVDSDAVLPLSIPGQGLQTIAWRRLEITQITSAVNLHQFAVCRLHDRCYKVLSRRFVKSFPAVSSGFEIETEMTVHALQLKMPVSEVVTTYRHRPEGSESKLKTVRDGVRILRLIVWLLKEERPFLFFTTISAIVAALSLLMGVPVVLEFMETGLVRRFPTAILASALGLAALVAFFSGLILDMVSRGRRETRRLQYLSIPAPGARARAADQRGH